MALREVEDSAAGRRRVRDADHAVLPRGPRAIPQPLARGVRGLDDRAEQRQAFHAFGQTRRQVLADQRAHGMADEMSGAAADLLDDARRSFSDEEFDREGVERARRAAGAGQVGANAAKAAERAEQHLERIRGAAEPVHEDDRRTPRRRSRSGSARPQRLSRAILPEFVLEHADAGDLDARDVAGHEIFRRLEADADARRACPSR